MSCIKRGDGLEFVRPYQTALLDEHPLIILPTLAKVFGLNEAVVIQQMHYWIRQNPHEQEGRKWVYNTYEDWQKQMPFMSWRTIQRIILGLERQGIIISGNFNRMVIDKTKWYSLDYNTIDQMVRPSCQNGTSNMPKWHVHDANLAPPLPETTTETNSETNLVKDIPYVQVVDHLNLKCGTKFRSTSDATRKLIKARFNEGFTLQDFITVIDTKSYEWLGTSMSEYLRPQTLFGTKFESYLNQKGGEKNGSSHWKHSRQVSSTRGTQDGRTFGVVKK